jgi:DNA-binding CsgD family transcriptional regulator
MATGGDIFDYYFTLSETFVLNVEFFLPRKSKTVILSDCPLCGASQSTYTNQLTVRAPLETLIEQIQQLFENDVTNLGSGEGNKELSAREVEVLQLVVKGTINKEIADKLNISLNTVLSHRKNITAKLGIKTVSGLIFYAIMHGIISAEDIDL